MQWRARAADRATQMTLNAVFLAACMFCVTRATPLAQLGPQRPVASVISPYALGSILAQFAVHVAALAHVAQLCKFENPAQGNAALQFCMLKHKKKIVIVIVIVIVIMPHMTSLVMLRFAMRLQPMDMPHSLDRNENGAIPGRSCRFHPAGNAIDDFRMRMATGFGSAVHRLDLGPERQRDGSADHRLGFGSKTLAFAEPAREIRRQRGARTDDGIAGKGIAKTNGRQPGDARVCGKLGKHLTRHQRQG